jgi:hypothetical protein
MRRLFSIWLLVLLLLPVQGQIARHPFHVPVATEQGGGYDSDLETYINGLTTELSSGQLDKLNTFFTDLKSDLGITNLSDVFDAMYILANETSESSLRNAVERDHDCTNYSASFTTLEGFTGNGTSQYISTDFVPSTDGVNFTQNSGAIGVYSRTAANPANEGCYLGVSDGVQNTCLQPYSSGEIVFSLNDVTVSYTETTSNAHAALWITTRTSSSAVILYKNKTTSTSDPATANSVGLPTMEFNILARKNYTREFYSVAQVSLAFVAEHITTAMRDAIVDNFEAYMDSNSKGIIP